MKTLKNKAKKGFTIVELVIVIAVIAILAAVLIPTFSGVINAANESVMMQECRAEWSNFLPEVAAKTGFGEATYYVAYDEDADGDTSAVDYEANYYFIVENATFDADNIIEGAPSVTSTHIDINYTYDYLNAKIKIYVPYDGSGSYSDGKDSEVGENEAAKVEAANTAAQTALSSAILVNVSSLDGYTTNSYTVYASVKDGTSTYYFKLAYDSNWSVSTDTVTYATYTSATGTTVDLTGTNSDYTVTALAVSSD